MASKKFKSFTELSKHLYDEKERKPERVRKIRALDLLKELGLSDHSGHVVNCDLL